MLGIVTAVVSLVAAILGLQKEQAQTTAEATGSDLSSLQREFNQLNNENQQLRSDNEELRSQLGLPSSPTAGPIPAEGVTIRHSGSLTLAYGGNTADLDSPASDPQWQTDESDVRYDYSGASGRNAFRVDVPSIRMGSTEADYDTCRNTTGYNTTGNYLISNIAIGDYFCLKTSERRYSAVKVTGATDQELSLDVVTYDPPGN